MFFCPVCPVFKNFLAKQVNPDTFTRFYLHYNTFLLFKYLYLDISRSEIYNRLSSGFEKYEGHESEFLLLHPTNIKKFHFFHLFYIHASYRIV